MLETSFESVAGRRLRVARQGRGPPLLLLHGYPDNLQIFERLAPKLSERFEVIAFDWPGMGKSEPWPGGATPDALAERLRELMDHWGLARATLFGMDMGGPPALVLSSRHPERVERLVCANGLVLADARTSWDIRLMRSHLLNRFVLGNFGWAVFLRSVRTFAPLGRWPGRELRQEFWEDFKRREVRAYITRMRAGYQASFARLTEVYRAIRVPTLVLWGEKDVHFPVEQARRLCEEIPGARLELLPEGRHWMAWHLADEVAASICLFAAG